MEIIETTQDYVLSTRASEDYELVLEAVKGNQKAFALLMERYRHPIYGMMLKMVRNEEDANDLTLEAFGKAFHKLPSYAPRYAFSTWLFKIAINNCIDYIRKRRLHLVSIDEPSVSGSAHQDYSNFIPSASLDPEESMMRNQRIEMVRNLLDKLSTKYRLMIELRFYEDRSYEEIAQELELPLGTVKAQLFRAKELLYGFLQMPSAQAYLNGTPLRKEKKAMNE
jgi:RNA polymerase sigma factor (sigma-70 family)